MSNNLISIYQSLPFHTDKGYLHSYLQVYDLLFGQYRHRPITFCEVGIAWGHSLLLWDKYFTHPKTKIIGLDISKEKLFSNVTSLFSSRIEIVIADIMQIRQSVIKDTIFDIALDDASHQLAHQKEFFDFFNARLNKNGLIIIEDVQSEKNLQKLLKWAPGSFYIDTRNISDRYDDLLLVYRE